MKKSKRVLFIALCVALALGIMSTACAKKTPAEKAPAPPQTTPAGTDVPTDASVDTPKTLPADKEVTDSGLENPIVSSSSDEIKSMIGIEFAAPDDAIDAKYSIIDQKVAQVEYSMDSGKGPIKVIYRASKSDTDESLSISGDFNKYSNTETAKLDGGQTLTLNTNDGTGAGLCLWYNKNTVSGGISGSISMDPIMQADQLTEVATFFVSQESKGF
ncbi:MAG: hypothetical protein LBO70_04160 [Clostridiales Family XIII bacterium]|jgi:hypothetical protein|nr:hypothetical protein [Clostridiales Family XIII bacterium]